MGRDRFQIEQKLSSFPTYAVRFWGETNHLSNLHRKLFSRA